MSFLNHLKAGVENKAVFLEVEEVVEALKQEEVLLPGASSYVSSTLLEFRVSLMDNGKWYGTAVAVVEMSPGAYQAKTVFKVVDTPWEALMAVMAATTLPMSNWKVDDYQNKRLKEKWGLKLWKPGKSDKR